MLKIEHIGIAVKSIKEAADTFSSLLDKSSYKVETVETEGVATSFFEIGESKVELLEATTTNSTIAKFIEKRGEGIHHLAFEVEDLQKEIARLKKEGFTILNEEPRKGADNKLVCFLHPKSVNGVLIELCQKIS